MEREESGGGGHLALKGTAGPRAVNPGGAADPRVGCPGGPLALGSAVLGDNLRGGLLTLRHRTSCRKCFHVILNIRSIRLTLLCNNTITVYLLKIQRDKNNYCRVLPKQIGIKLQISHQNA